MAPMGTYPVEVATILHMYLGPFIHQARLGRMMVEALFRIDDQTEYRPDLAFVSDGTWPLARRSPRKQPWAVVPDLAVEVVSEHDKAWDVMEKVRDYFRAGSRAVWLVYPNLESIQVFESFTSVKILTKNDALEGGEVIPGFRLSLAELFRGEPAEEDVEQAD
jgi:Uma2 family endonuclease